MPKETDDLAILLFDGVCNSCNLTVDIILRSRARDCFRFAALQSQVGAELLNAYHLPTDTMDTLVLIDKGRALTRSQAAFRISRLLGFPYSVLSVFAILPGGLTDWVYRLYSRNRYRLFGKREVCRVLTENERALFMENK